jgi:serine/threonine transporter
MDLKELYSKWNSISLIVRIICGLAIGLVLALIIPGYSYISVFGEIFVSALKAIAPLLVMFLVIGSLSTSGSGLGSRFKLVIALYLASTIIAAVVATALGFINPVTVFLDTSSSSGGEVTGLWDLIHNILVGLMTNPVKAITDANYLSIIFWSVIFGLIIKSLKTETVGKACDELSKLVSKVVTIIISFAPIGIMGLIYDAVSSNGLDIFVDYGSLILLLVAAMLIVMFITNPILGAIVMRRNPYPLLLTCLRGSAITAFFTRSSAANIPVNMSLCDKMGLDKDFYSVSIPLGATINMNGAAITITTMTLVAVHTLGIEVTFASAAVMCVVAALGACGASGITGGSLFLIPMACALFGINDDIAAQLIAIGFIIGVIQDSLETALNSSMDVYFTAAAEVAEGVELKSVKE